MSELNGHAGLRRLWQELGLLPCLGFEGRYILGEGFFHIVVSHIQHAETQLADAEVATHVIVAVLHALDQFLWQRSVRLIMKGKGVQKLLLCDVVLHELRGQFHKVAIYIGSALRHETHAGEESMQGVTEFMQEGFHLAQCEQRGLILGGFGEIHGDAYMRPMILSVLIDILFGITGHPGTALLVFSGVEVGIEHTQIRSVLIQYLICFHIGMIHGDVLAQMEGDAIQTCGQSENALLHIFQLEVGA